MRRLERNFGDSRAEAIKIRERFMDRPAEREEKLPWSWPKRMKEVGRFHAGAGAIMYASDKWQKRRDQLVDYKHVSEAPQRLLVVPGFLREFARPGKKLSVGGPMVELNAPMPTAVAKLAPILGIQAQLYEGDEQDYHLNGDDGFYQINIAGAELFAAVHPKTGQTFLSVCDKGGPLCIITGEQLAVLEDGIVG